MKNISKISKEQWQELFKLIPIIARTKNFGKLATSKKNKDGSFTFPYMQPAKIVSSFQYIIYEIGIVNSFDWPAWEEGKQLLKDSKTDFNKLDIKTLCMLTTAIVRNDRFCDGALVNAFEQGIILKLLNALKFKTQNQTSNYDNSKLPKYANVISTKLQNVQLNKTKTK